MKKVYSGQALAVVMIVLVISVVLGLAMLSRTLRDTRQVANEKSSAEALELADSVLDTFKGISLDKLDQTCTSYGGLRSTEGCKVEGATQVKTFMDTAGVSDNAIDSFDKCTNENSNIELTAKLASAEDEYELRSDKVRSFIVRQQTPNPSTCQLQLSFEPRGSSFGGVVISKIYARNYDANGIPAEYKTYAFNDIQQYCIHLTGSLCANSGVYQDSWTQVQSGTMITVPLAASGVYPLDEIRVRSVGGTVSMKASLSNPGCIQKWEMVKLTVGANCSGTYRAKEVQFPQTESALPLFDYVLFNGEGTLGTE